MKTEQRVEINSRVPEGGLVVQKLPPWRTRVCPLTLVEDTHSGSCAKTLVIPEGLPPLCAD